jgi:hypothetical protein
LLSGTTLSWFALLLEKDSLLLEDLEDFLTKFNDTFGKTDRVQKATTKIRLLYQASVYTADFCQLVCDVDWDDDAFISAFWWGLQDDAKDLFLNLHNPLTLTKAITKAVQCDNQLFEHRQERRSIQVPYKAEAITPWKQVPTNASMPEPMQIDFSRFKKLL